MKYNKQTQIFWLCNLSAADKAVWKLKIHKLLCKTALHVGLSQQRNSFSAEDHYSGISPHVTGQRS